MRTNRPIVTRINILIEMQEFHILMKRERAADKALSTTLEYDQFHENVLIQTHNKSVFPKRINGSRLGQTSIIVIKITLESHQMRSRSKTNTTLYQTVITDSC